MEKPSESAVLRSKRREFFKLAATAGGSAYLAGRAIDAFAKDPPVPPFTTPFKEELPVYRPKQASSSLSPPPQASANPDKEAGRDNHPAWSRFPIKKMYEIDVKRGSHSFHSDLSNADIWGYDGKFPGPTFVAYVGEPILVRFYNNLERDANGFGSPEISTHLHNGHTPSESDGYAGNYFSKTVRGPTIIRPGEFYDHHYPNCYAGVDSYPNTPGDAREAMSTLWYHDHREGFTAPNVYRGLAGFYLLFDDIDSNNEQDGNSRALRLPSGVGDYDIPLIITNPRFDAGGGLIFDQFDTDGFLGNKIAVNGKIQPFYKVARRKYRFRVLNGSNSRFYNLSLRFGNSNKSFKVIASDGNLLPHPVTMTSFQIAPAERFDIVVDFTGIAPGSALFLTDRIIQTTGRGPEPALHATGTPLLRFDVDGDRDATDNSQVPDNLRTLPDINLNEVKVQRRLEFERRNGAWAVNGKIFEVDKPAIRVKKGTAEIWTLKSKGNWHHPVHIHFEEGRILSRNGRPPAAHEAGRRDVYVLAPNDELRIFLRFRDFTGKYMMHCHNTIHEDHAMMLRFDIEE
jgi:FtsP/CotA-like multicopper oxidase with cupredoxin domain